MTSTSLRKAAPPRSGKRNPPLRLALFSLVLAAGLVLAFAAGRPHGAWGHPVDAPPSDFEIEIDANADNGEGPCNPIDAEATVQEGAEYHVAVCVLNSPKPVYAFLMRVVYNGQLDEAPEVPDVAPALDDNPDANAGATTFSNPDLGDRWDCTGLTVLSPRGNDENTRGIYDAFMACNADLLNPDTKLTNGPLEVITFKAIGQGDDTLELHDQSHIADEVGVIGRCLLGEPETIPCQSAVIHIAGGTPQATRTPSEASPAPTMPPATSPAASPEGATPAGAAATASTDEGNGFPWAVLGGVLGGIAVLAVVAAGLYLWSRGAGGTPQPPTAG